MDHVNCSWPFNDGTPVKIGAPLPHMVCVWRRDVGHLLFTLTPMGAGAYAWCVVSCQVWRSNHPLHPRVAETAEPLWNDTVLRYFLLRDRLQEAAAERRADGSTGMDALQALGISR